VCLLFYIPLLREIKEGKQKSEGSEGRGYAFIEAVDTNHFIAELGMHIPSFAIECRATIRIGRGSGQIPYKLGAMQVKYNEKQANLHSREEAQAVIRSKRFIEARTKVSIGLSRLYGICTSPEARRQATRT
jgi:hypothetical protein